MTSRRATPQSTRASKAVNPRYAERHTGTLNGGSTVPPEHSAEDHYFAATPHSADVRHLISLEVRGHSAKAETSNGVFSTSGLDKGTAVLLKLAPSAPQTGTFLDLGCGWGPISLALGFESPQASVWAVDINERAVELTQENAKRNHLTNISAVTAEGLDEKLTFDLIWSNPPIRVGKAILHELLMTYLPRLAPGGRAYLVVQKHLGADSLIPWLDEALGNDYSVVRYDSSKGFRIIEVSKHDSSKVSPVQI